ASAFQLQQVLLNLITNAQDELRDRDGRREITVAAAADPLGCVLEVRDSGPGIPRAILPRVFEPFFTTKQTATGLGLAISAGIVERFGGRVTAAHRLTRPRAAPAGRPAPAVPTPRRSASPPPISPARLIALVDRARAETDPERRTAALRVAILTIERWRAGNRGLDDGVGHALER